MLLGQNLGPERVLQPPRPGPGPALATSMNLNRGTASGTVAVDLGQGGAPTSLVKLATGRPGSGPSQVTDARLPVAGFKLS